MEKREVDLDIETDIDRFYSFIQKAQSAEVQHIAASLGIEKQLVERYADILSKHDKVIVNYPILGKAIVYSKEKASEEAQKDAQILLEIFSLIAKKPGITAKSIADNLKIKTPEAERYIVALEKHGKIRSKKGIFGSIRWYQNEA